MKTLFIAEKPDIARAIAGHLFPDGYTKTKHYYEKGDATVTWAFGHILRMAEPAEYDERYKAWSEYPIFPTDWKVLPMASSKEQLDAIGKLLKSHDTVVNAGDPDREGQLLVDDPSLFRLCRPYPAYPHQRQGRSVPEPGFLGYPGEQ